MRRLSTMTAVREAIWFLICLFLLGWDIPATAAPTRRSPNEVLLVYNANSPTSTAIANYYAQKRNITNILAVNCQDSALSKSNETIELADYTSEIAGPVSAYLANHSGINFIVLTKGIPIRIDGGNTGSQSGGAPGVPQPSLDSYLAAIDYPNLSGATQASLTGSGTTGAAWINRYYNSTVPFSHAQFGGYIVTRFDGYTQSDAMSLVDRALAAERAPSTGPVLFDMPADFGIGDKTTRPLLSPATTVTQEANWGTWNADMLHMADIFEAANLQVVPDIVTTFIGGQTNLAGYYSWGSNDDHYSVSAYQSNQFAAGSIGDTAVSTSARTFLQPFDGGQSLIADLVSQGITGVAGYTNEPILDGATSPTLDLSHYYGGYSLGESFYAGIPYLGWEDVILGDPLCTPYLGKYHLVDPTMASTFTNSAGGVQTESCSESGLDVGYITNGSYTEYTNVNLTGSTSFVARVASAGSGGNVKVVLDSLTGPVVATVAVPITGNWQTWTTVSSPITVATGQHNVFLEFAGSSGYLFNIQWFAFTSPASPEGPFGGTAVAIPGTVQAENYDTGGLGLAYNVSSINGTGNGYRSDGVDLETASDMGGGYDLGWTSGGQWFHYTINVATAGTYTVSFRVAAPSAVTDAFHLSNSSGMNLSGNINVPTTGGWQNWTTVTATVTLPAGTQILTLNEDNGGWNINYMTLDLSAAEGPFGGTAAAIPGTVQAENHDTGGQGLAYNVSGINGTGNNYRSDGVDLETTTDTGGGYDLGWTSGGQWFNYTLNVATAGSYTVSFRLAAPSAVTDAFHLSNSSGMNLSGNINVPTTGGWQNWTTVTATVTLPAGTQILTLDEDNGGWNINYVIFAGQ